MLNFLQSGAVGGRRGAERHLRAWSIGIVMTVVLMPASAPADLDDDYNLALQFYKQDRWDFAATQFESFLKQAPADHPKAPLAKLYLGQAYVHQRKFAEARPVFRDFVKNYPQQEDIPLAMYRVAECSYFLDDFEAAQTELNAFLAKVPADHVLAEWALQYLGETDLQLKQYDAARQAFEQGLTQFPNGRLKGEMQFGLARAFDGLGRTDEARGLYEQIAGSDGPRAADAQFNLAARLFDDKQYQQAAEQFEAIPAKYPDNKIVPLAALNAGYSHFHLSEFPQAIEWFAKVRGDEKLGPTAEYWTGLSLKAQQQWDAAAKTLLDQFQKDENQPLAELLLFHAADARLGEKNYAEALRLFRDVHRRWPTGEMADDSLQLATEAAMLAGDYAAAKELNEQFVREFPQSGLKLPQELLAGRLLLTEGDQLARTEGADSEAAKQRYRDAAGAFQQIVTQSTIPQTVAVARLQLARAWDRLANHQQALEALQPLVDAAKQSDASDDARTALAMQSTALLSLKKYDEAIATATEYLSHPSEGPEAAEAQANLALAYAHKLDWAASAEALSKLRETGNRRLADRVTYEVAEAAYDASEWDVAAAQYERVVDAGSEGEFYRPAISGLAYSLHEQGTALDKQYREAQAQGNDAVGTLAQAISKFEEAGRWFTQLAELSGEQGDRVVRSDALYMNGLSLRLARRTIPDATTVFMEAAREFGLPADAQSPDEATLKAAYNAYRSAKEAARAFQDAKQTESADAAYQVAHDQLKRLPADQQAHLDSLINEWALLHYNAGDYARADELFQRLVDERPDSQWADDARMLIAENLYFDGKYEQAREALKPVAADEATDDFVRQRSLVLLMDIAVRLKDWPDAAAAAKTLAERYPEGSHHWEARYRQGEAALQQGELEAAKAIFTELHDQKDNQTLAAEEWFPGIWLMLAETSLRLKEYDKVKQIAEEFAERFPDSPLRYHFDDIEGRALKNQSHFEEARAAFGRVIDSEHGKKTETAAKAQLFIAETYLIQKEYEKAFEAYYRVLLYGFPEWQAMALFQAGQCEEQLKRWKGAAKSYRLLLEEHPDSDYAVRARERLADLEQRFPDTVGN